MKKIIATALCLTLGAPCFAMGPMGPHHKPHPRPHQNITYVNYNVPPRHMHTGHHYGYTTHHHHMSPGAKTAVAVAGVAGLAMIVSAIVD